MLGSIVNNYSGTHIIQSYGYEYSFDMLKPPPLHLSPTSKLKPLETI